MQDNGLVRPAVSRRQDVQMVAASPDLRRYIGAAGGACVIALFLPNDRAAAAVAMQAARERVLAVRHPEEPDEPFVSYVSDVNPTEEGAVLWLDAADVGAYPGLAEQLIEALVQAATAVVGDRGELRPAPDDRPAVEHASERAVLPPTGFPIPDFVEVDWTGGRLFTMATETNADDVRRYFVEELPLAGFNVDEPFAIDGMLPAFTFRGTVIPIERNGVVGQLVIYEYGDLLVDATPDEEAEFVRRRAARQPARLECYWGQAPVKPGSADFSGR